RSHAMLLHDFARDPRLSPPLPSTTLFRSRSRYGRPPLVQRSQVGVGASRDAEHRDNRPTRRLAAPHDARATVGEGASVTADGHRDRKSTRLNSSHGSISYAVLCLKKRMTT